MSSELLITLRIERFPDKRAETGACEWEANLIEQQDQLCKDGFLRSCELGRTSASTSEWLSIHPSTKSTSGDNPSKFLPQKLYNIVN